MRILFKVLFVGIVLLGFLPTLNAQENLKAYYFPIEQLDTPKVYHYKCSEPVLGDIFWVLKTEKSNDSTFLITDSYNRDTTGKLMHVEYLKEWINDTAAMLIEYKTYLYSEERNQNYEIVKEELVEVKAQINSSEVFKWEQKPTEILKFIFSYALDSATINHVRKIRNFTNTFDEITFKEKNIKAYIFEDKISKQSETKDLKNSYTFDITRQCYYAKGIGLFKYNQFSLGFNLTYELAGILSLDEWNKAMKKQ